jgi:hypothetical protein
VTAVLFRLPVVAAAIVALVFQIGCRESHPTKGVVEEPHAVSALLPASGDLAGWVRLSEPEFFGPSDLWEYIDGQADFYLDYGFRRVDTAEYSSGEGARSLVAEIYRMSTPDEAFGIYAAERTPEERRVEVGVEGYVGSNVVNFWKGPYYVKLTSFSAAPEIESALLDFARVIATRIEGEYEVPPLFAVFPAKHRVESSERYIPRNFLGQPYLSRGYRADYEIDGRRCQLVLVENDSPDLAVAALDRYARFLESQGYSVIRTDWSGHGVVTAQGDRSTLLYQSGSLVGGVVGIDDPVLGEEIARDLLSRSMAADLR